MAKKRHSNKGPKSQRQSMKEMPFIEMTKDERDEAFADMAGWRERLAGLRAAENKAAFWAEHFGRLQLALLWLVTPNKERLLIDWDVEAGDGMGLSFINGAIRQIEITKALLPGERVEWELVEPAGFTVVSADDKQIESLKRGAR